MRGRRREFELVQRDRQLEGEREGATRRRDEEEESLNWSRETDSSVFGRGGMMMKDPRGRVVEVAPGPKQEGLEAAGCSDYTDVVSEINMREGEMLMEQGGGGGSAPVFFCER
ncbi:unnamed protein product [Pleuronectes platessa]|uniref:Uncharacterized protein n=1 Tax=Pleuronectes platessa TaxID=8262 RepID=A0A9N7TPY5_PLEPL|nr:unnamed protein product [Pleuronectes platessa]